MAERILIIAKGVEKILEEHESKIVSLLESVYEKKFPFKKIRVYLTTANLLPYSYKDRWFMSGRNSSLDHHVSTAKHELNHFMFYYYYPNLKNKLGVKKYEVLKEALAIFTNPKGNDKPSVKKLEIFLKKLSGQKMDDIIKIVFKEYFKIL